MLPDNDEAKVREGLFLALKLYEKRDLTASARVCVILFRDFVAAISVCARA